MAHYYGDYTANLPLNDLRYGKAFIGLHVDVHPRRCSGNPQIKTFRLWIPNWVDHLPRQHYDLRLTAEDGYQVEHSYSIASSPKQTDTIDLTVELVEGGVLSDYLHEEVAVGDLLEVRGPVGGYFV